MGSKMILIRLGDVLPKFGDKMLVRDGPMDGCTGSPAYRDEWTHLKKRKEKKPKKEMK